MVHHGLARVMVLHGPAMAIELQATETGRHGVVRARLPVLPLAQSHRLRRLALGSGNGGQLPESLAHLDAVARQRAGLVEAEQEQGGEQVLSPQTHLHSCRRPGPLPLAASRKPAWGPTPRSPLGPTPWGEHQP